MNRCVLVVGSGNLGCRHIESLELSKHKLDVFVVDSSEKALSNAQEILGKITTKNTICYLNDIDFVTEAIDIAIVATTANSRLAILKTLVGRGVKNIILEKIAFNSLQDIEEAIALVSAVTETKVWVNCPRRLYPIYKQLKNKLLGATFKKFSVTGYNYGMGCNGIHFIDIASYLIGDCNYRLSSQKINSVNESKRAGYIELFGVLDGVFKTGCELQLECESDSGRQELKLHLEMEEGSLSINESAGEAVLDFNGSVKTIGFRVPYQSELTGPLVDEVFSQGDCGLTTFEESMVLNLPFISETYKAYATRFGENDRKFIPLT